MKITDLEPKIIWKYFNEITQIPRPSGKEEKIRQYLIEFAQKHNIECKTDKIGNILMIKPAKKGCEDKKSVILQGHVDMVCEKNNDIEHNFEKDPIETYVEKGWLKAKGTTLGADNGMGVAAILAVMVSDSIRCGKITGIFTIGEETGLIGANAIDPEFLEGDIMLNLDTEEEGEIYIGCAGGKISTAFFDYQKSQTPENYFWFEAQVSGLNGGHSGADIHKGLGNANKILNRYLWTLAEKTKLCLASFNGGNLHNAIAREASAVAGIPANAKETAIIELNLLLPRIEEELKHIDPNVKIEIHSTSKPDSIIDNTTAHRLLNAIYACPHGVIDMSFEIEGMVETSTNLASVKTKADTIILTTSQRSSTESLRDNAVNMVQSVFNLAGAKVEHSNGYPGWKPNAQSEILSIAKGCYKKLYGHEPLVKAIHAGLECGLFYELNPNLDIISCGPTITDAHSPAEQVEIITVQKWWDFLVQILNNIPAK